jgi:hypothetical protein
VSDVAETVAPRCYVTAHTLSHNGWRRTPAHRATRNGLLHLGWSHFWLLFAILGGMLGLVMVVFFAYLSF